MNLWEVAADATDTAGHAQLLERAGMACWRVGRAREGYRLFRAALDLVSAERDPLWASRLTRWVSGTADGGGLSENPSDIEDERRAVELSGVDPDSGEHAEALAQLSDTLWWDGRTEEAHRLVEDAVAVAHRSGSASAISWAHGHRAMQYLETDLERADLDCQVSWDYAMASGLPQLISSAYTDRFNLLWTQGDQRRMLEHARDHYTWSAGEGWRTVFPAVLLASALLAVGDLREAEGIVRAGLAASDTPSREAHIRLQATTLAVRRGAKDAARDHLRRARELQPDLEQRPGLMAGSPIAERLLAQDDPAAAFELVERVLPVNAVDTRVVDELMVWGAQAAADLVQRASDDRDQTAVKTHREALCRLVETRATLPGVAFQPSGPDDTTQVAWAGLFAAESGRAGGAEDQIGLWRDGGRGVCHGRSRLGPAGLDVATRLRADRVRRPGRRGSSTAPRRPRVRHPAERHPTADPRRRARRQRTHLTYLAEDPARRHGARSLHRIDRTRDRGSRPPRGEPHQRRDRPDSVHQREDRERARLEPAAQDSYRVTPRGCRAGPSRWLGIQHVEPDGVSRVTFSAADRAPPGL